MMLLGKKTVGKHVRPTLHEASIIITNNPSLLLLIPHM